MDDSKVSKVEETVEEKNMVLAEDDVNSTKVDEYADSSKRTNDQRKEDEESDYLESLKASVTATPKERRELYYDHLYSTDDDYADYKSEAQIRQEEYNELLIAMKSKKILTGMISHQEEQKGIGDTPRRFACVPYGDNFDVLIPFPWLEPGDYSKMDDNWVVRRLDDRVGSTVDYIITSINEVTGICVANRLEAMQIKAASAYLPRGRREPNLQEGFKALARVCYRKKNSMCVEVEGIETELPAGEIAHRRIANVRDEFGSVTKIPVKLKRVEIERIGNATRIEIKASAREATANPMVRKFKRFVKGHRFQGIVAGNDGANYFVNEISYNATVLCSIDRQLEVMPAIGDKVWFFVDGTNEEEFRVHGRIVKIIV